MWGTAKSSHRFEPAQHGQHDVASLAVLQVEKVKGQSTPQVNAGDPGQDGVLETWC